jgi:hypothetical protein
MPLCLWYPLPKSKLRGHALQRCCVCFTFSLFSHPPPPLCPPSPFLCPSSTFGARREKIHQTDVRRHTRDISSNTHTQVCVSVLEWDKADAGYLMCLPEADRWRMVPKTSVFTSPQVHHIVCIISDLPVSLPPSLPSCLTASKVLFLLSLSRSLSRTHTLSN